VPYQALPPSHGTAPATGRRGPTRCVPFATRQRSAGASTRRGWPVTPSRCCPACCHATSAGAYRCCTGTRITRRRL